MLFRTKHIQNYFVKLTDAIITLMPNEERVCKFLDAITKPCLIQDVYNLLIIFYILFNFQTVYYIPAQTPGNDTKNPKGKLPDKWRNYLYNLRIRGIISKKRKEKEKEKIIQQDTMTQSIKGINSNILF